MNIFHAQMYPFWTEKCFDRQQNNAGVITVERYVEKTNRIIWILMRKVYTTSIYTTTAD